MSASVGRGTFSNDSWISGDLVNSAQFLFSGDDTRNYFRATRGEATLGRRWDWSATSIEPYLGGRWETDRSVRPDSFALGGPWTLLGRDDRDDGLRANPEIDNGIIASALIGVQLRWSDAGIVARMRLDEELGHFSPAAGADRIVNSGFVQSTFDGSIRFPTFGAQSIRIDGHAVYTGPGPTPRQRWSYIGGLSTIPTVELLSLGGDRLIYFDGRYLFPLGFIKLPFGQVPVLSLREVLAGAAVGTAPTLAQATGIRIALSILYAEVLEDPVGRRAHYASGLSLTP